MKKGTKIVFFLIVGLGLSISTKAAVNYYKVRKEEEEKMKFVRAMREKYKEIKNIDDFNEGVKYVEFPTPFGYDLRLFKDVENISEILTFDELKFIYEAAQLGLSNRNDEYNLKLLNTLQKIYPN